MERRLPGPRGRALLTTLGRLQSDFAADVFRDVAREYGDVVRLPIPLRFAYTIVSHPDGVQHVLQKNHKNYGRPHTYQYLKAALGNGLLLAEGELWKRQRRTLSPAFHRHVITGITDTVVQCTREMLDRWSRDAAGSASQPINLADEMMSLTLRVAGKILFGAELGDDAARVGAALQLVADDTHRRAISLFMWPRWLPTGYNRRFWRAVRELRRVAAHILHVRGEVLAAEESEHPSLIDMLVNAHDPETGDPMTAQQLLDEVVTFVLAGYETTSNALSWVWALLLQHPDQDERVRAELAEALPDGRPPAAEDFGRLPIAGACIDEAMRLYPPAWVLERRPLAPDVIMDYEVPVRSVVFASPWVVHRREDFWPEPEQFRPDRFLGDAVKERHPFAYFPFGAGPRMCIGRDFALLEARLILAMMAQRFRFRLAESHPAVEPEVHVTLRPKHGVWVTVEPV